MCWKADLRCGPVLLAVTAIHLLSSRIHGQELPNPEFMTEQFNETANFRQSVCDRQDLFHHDLVDYSTALKDLELRAVIIPSEYLELNAETGGIDEEYPGLLGVLLDELSNRAGFTWRNSYAVTLSGPVEGKTWTELLDWSTEKYDISVDWWAKSLSRMAIGISFPESWYDASIIIVADTTGKDEGNQFHFWSFLAPFSTQVWILIVASIVFSGIVYWLLETIDKKSDKRRLEANVVENIFLSGITFTTHFEFHPRTNPARLFTFSLSFWAMLTSAAYTANLASFLVVKNTPKLQIHTVSDAVRHNLRMCILQSTQADEAVSKAFPNAVLIRKTQPDQVFSGVTDQECHVAITTVSAWEYWQRSNVVNGDCALGWIGRTFLPVPAGFATKSDSGTQCTSLIRDVINYHMLEMKIEGFIEQAWDAHLARTATIDCEAMANLEQEQEESDQLNLQNLGGIFLFHYALSALAIVTALFYKYKGWDQIPKFAKDGQFSRKSVRNLMENMPNDDQKTSKAKELMIQAAQKQSFQEMLASTKTLSRRQLFRDQKNNSNSRASLKKEDSVIIENIDRVNGDVEAPDPKPKRRSMMQRDSLQSDASAHSTGSRPSLPYDVEYEMDQRQTDTSREIHNLKESLCNLSNQQQDMNDRIGKILAMMTIKGKEE